jgi:hypothetical protein
MTSSPAPSVKDEVDYDPASILLYAVVGILVLMYMALVVWLSMRVYVQGRYALTLVVLIGSFACPIIVPIAVLILMNAQVLSPVVRTIPITSSPRSVY